MSFVSQMKSDIFLSYHPDDNTPVPGTGEGWISTLTHVLKTELAIEVRCKSDEIQIYQQTLDNPESIDHIRDRLRGTALILIILSSHYIEFYWGPERRPGFRDYIKALTQDREKVILIEKDQINEEQRPFVFTGLPYSRFWKKSGDGSSIIYFNKSGDSNDTSSYYAALKDICGAIAVKLNKLKNKTDTSDSTHSAFALNNKISQDAEGYNKENMESLLKDKRDKSEFDVFLCHNSEDKPEVKKIGEQLKARGILPWLDEWEICPGKSWLQELGEQISRIKTAAVFIGDKGAGPWQNVEIETFIIEFVKRKCPVILVLLPTAPDNPEIPVLLSNLMWVDFRKQDPDPMDQLLWGITGEQVHRTRPCVFLAEVTDDLDQLRNEVKRYLDQEGIYTLPDKLYPRNPEKFRAAVEKDLDTSVLFVQLLSNLSGKQLPGIAKTYAQIQYDSAKAKNKRIFQWRHRDIDPSSVMKKEHRLLLENPTVKVTGIEEFKRVIVERTFEEPASPFQTSPFIFVDLDISDKEIADKVRKTLKNYGADSAGAMLQGKASDIWEDLERNLKECDGVIIIYGSTTASWIRKRLLHYRKIIINREQPLKALAVFEGPPEEKVPLDIDIHNMETLDCKTGIDESIIKSFIKKLNR